jgi:hypothetical protein
MLLTSVKRVLLFSPWVYRTSRWLIGLLFIWAGAIKLIAPKVFAHNLSQFGLVPEPLLVPTAIGLPSVEVLAGIGLIFDVGLTLWIITGMLIVDTMPLEDSYKKNHIPDAVQMEFPN